MDAYLSRIRKGVEALLILTLVGMVLLTFADVIGRRLFGTPVFGAHDATQHLMAIMVFCGLPLLTAARGHLAVDLFDNYLMKPSMAWWHRVIALLMTLVLLLIAYEFFNAAIEAGRIQEISQALSIPRSGMYAFISFTSLLSALAALLGCFGAPASRPRLAPPRSRGACQMTVGLLSLLAVLVLAFLRVPLAFALLSVSLAGISVVMGWDVARSLVPMTISEAAFSYELAVVPMFILMGNILARSGISDDLFRAANAFLGPVRAGLALILSIVQRRMSWASFRQIFVETATTSVMLYSVLFGALLFAKLISFSGLGEGILELVQEAGLGPYQTLAAILLIFLLLGCVMESLAIILICVPLFLPLLMSHGFDLVWFGIIVVVVTEIALITPPIGMNVFVLKAALPHVRLGAIFRGLLPFVGIDLLRLVLLVVFPSITLALVALMK